MTSELERAYSNVVRFGFCEYCHSVCGSETCKATNCYQNNVKPIHDALEKVSMENTNKDKTKTKIKFDILSVSGLHEFVKAVNMFFGTEDDSDSYCTYVDGNPELLCIPPYEFFVGKKDWKRIVDYCKLYNDYDIADVLQNIYTYIWLKIPESMYLHLVNNLGIRLIGHSHVKEESISGIVCVSYENIIDYLMTESINDEDVILKEYLLNVPYIRSFAKILLVQSFAETLLNINSK